MVEEIYHMFLHQGGGGDGREDGGGRGDRVNEGKGQREEKGGGVQLEELERDTFSILFFQMGCN